MGLRSLELFAGYAGGCLASQHLLDFETQCYVERDPAAIARLVARIGDGYLHDAPIWDDVRTFRAYEWRGKVDVVCGGPPCPSFSVAGKGLAGADPRNCWPETLDIIRCIRPRFAFLENVPGLLAGSHGYFGHILGELAGARFDVEWGVLSAADLGAPHERKRLWILATDASGNEFRDVSERAAGGRLDVQGGWEALARDDGTFRNAPDTLGEQPAQRELNEQQKTPDRLGGVAPDLHGGGRSIERFASLFNGERAALRNNTNGRADPNPWAQGSAPEPTVPRMDDGVAGGLDASDQWVARTRGTGNGQVPLVAATAWRLLVERLEDQPTDQERDSAVAISAMTI